MVKKLQIEAKLHQFQYIGLECALPHWGWWYSVAGAAEAEGRPSVLSLHSRATTDMMLFLKIPCTWLLHEVATTFYPKQGSYFYKADVWISSSSKL